jgi:hypothetical protein
LKGADGKRLDHCIIEVAGLPAMDVRRELRYHRPSSQRTNSNAGIV